MQTVGCKTVVGDATQYEIINWKGSSSMKAEDTASMSLTSLKAREASSTSDADNFRPTYQEDDYSTYEFAGRNRYQPCRASLDLPKINRDAATFTNYTVTMGSRVYETEDATDFVTLTEETFDYELSPPDYFFGDEAEFDEAPYEDELFNEYRDFQMSDFDSSATGTGFQMFAGGFSVIPNFSTALWKFKFDLDMPGQYFDETNVLYNWATFQDTA
jgi:hypothetical protein